MDEIQQNIQATGGRIRDIYYPYGAAISKSSNYVLCSQEGEGTPTGPLRLSGLLLALYLK